MQKDHTVRLIAQIVLVVAIVALGYFGRNKIASLREPPSQAPPASIVPLVETVAVKSGPVELFVEAQGTVVPYIETLLLAEVAGRVLEIAPELREGARVAADQMLVRIDDSDYRLAVAEASAAVAQAELNLEQTRADAESARRDWERSGSEGEPSPLLLREPQLADARAQLELARARMERARRDLERSVVQAPFEGRVLAALVNRGQFVARGAHLATLMATDVLEVRIPLPDPDLAHLDLPLGGRVAPEEAPEVRLSTFFGGEERRWQGRIVRTEARLDPASRMIVAVARVDEPLTDDGEVPLSVGMFVEARIRGRLLLDEHVLPRAALRTGDRVFVVDDDERLRFRGVEVLRRTESDVVVGSGIENGERVVVSPLEAPVDGMQVRPIEAVR
ncbi:MAG: efflux RND transporter periplasmic adaptor subunit [Planctomycetota bacterium]